MSGRKRIQVDESEWYRIQRQARDLRKVQREVPNLIDAVRRQTRADLDRTFTRVERRQQQHDELIGRLSDQTRELEQDTARRLQQQATELRGELAAGAGQLREETRQRLAEQQERTRQAIAAERAERRAETSRVSARIDAIDKDRAQAGQLVRSWLSDARAMTAAIAEAALHERYAPGELDRLTDRLATAEQNAAQGRFDAALALAQETYHSLSELRTETEQRELERCTAQMAAIDALVTVEEEIEGNLIQPVLGPDGEPVDGYTVDVGFWSQGELDRLREETADGLARARDDRTGTGELNLLREQEAPRLEGALGNTVGRACLRHLASQTRVSLADAVVQALGRTAFYEFVDGEYQDADPRGTYYAKLVHENGNQIVLDISQAEPDSGRHVVRVLSYDHDITAEAQLQERAAAIGESLKDEGYPVSGAASEPGAPDRKLLDIQSHRDNPAHAVEGGA
ncbi:hypothetical protein AQI95_14915 [Streptomyces yokosukanensis]|uniref:Uncharacterized protein n=1 Tax=Streptomyces yokosukanensis TaxID=67386 RepID=A0A101P776_9ACTN|nr:hypothetical protein [Streptomyces yokosukanensis]KUN06183.1 hypothetical protein AQI95_14915 [Streptomyces yokosukanensis]